MKYPIICLLSLFVISCREPDVKTKRAQSDIYNKNFDWTITIPENFESVTPEQWRVMQNRGAEAIEETHDEKIESRANTIFVFKNDQFNYFESNYQPFDTLHDGNYEQSFKSVNALLYSTFTAQMPDAKLDSSSSLETISGLSFHKFAVNVIFPNQTNMDFLMYSRLFDKKEFTVNIMTVDKSKQIILLDAWRNSTFGKK